MRAVPPISYDFVPRDGRNLFREKFGHLTDLEWSRLLVRSINEPVIEDVQFPAFPDDGLQNHMHGGSGTGALVEASDFFRFVKENTYRTSANAAEKRFLDFGSGWGRIVRPFMRDFEFSNLYGFEPDFLFCALARTLNPYVAFFSGAFVPTGNLPEQFFHLVASWSVFSHLSQTAAVLWLKELARVVVPGGSCVITTWGDRFLKRLQADAVQQSAGQEIHWYSSVCLAAAGSIEERLADYDRGEFVWFTSGQSTAYGEAFVSETALVRLISQYQLSFAVSLADKTTLGQDVFLLTRL